VLHQGTGLRGDSVSILLSHSGIGALKPHPDPSVQLAMRALYVAVLHHPSPPYRYGVREAGLATIASNIKEAINAIRAATTTAAKGPQHAAGSSSGGVPPESLPAISSSTVGEQEEQEEEEEASILRLTCLKSDYISREMYLEAGGVNKEIKAIKASKASKASKQASASARTGGAGGPTSRARQAAEEPPSSSSPSSSSSAESLSAKLEEHYISILFGCGILARVTEEPACPLSSSPPPAGYGIGARMPASPQLPIMSSIPLLGVLEELIAALLLVPPSGGVQAWSGGGSGGSMEGGGEGGALMSMHGEHSHPPPCHHGSSSIDTATTMLIVSSALMAMRGILENNPDIPCTDLLDDARAVGKGAGGMGRSGYTGGLSPSLLPLVLELLSESPSPHRDNREGHRERLETAWGHRSSQCRDSLTLQLLDLIPLLTPARRGGSRGGHGGTPPSCTVDVLLYHMQHGGGGQDTVALKPAAAPGL